MAVTTTTRFGVHQWSADSDPPVNRTQLTGDNLAVETLAAGYLENTAASRPAAAAANKGFLFRATDTGAWSVSTGAAWVNVPVGTYLPLSGGTLAGNVDYAANQIKNATVVQARDLRFTASVSGSVTIDAANGPSQTLTLTGNVTGITVNNLNDGESLRITLLEDATGGRTVVFPGTWVWVGGATVATAVLKTTANARNTLIIEKIGSTIEAFLVGDQKT